MSNLTASVINEFLTEHAREWGTPQTFLNEINGEGFFGFEIYTAHLSYARGHIPNLGTLIERFPTLLKYLDHLPFAPRDLGVPIVVDSIRLIAIKSGDRYLLKKITPSSSFEKEREELLETAEAMGVFPAEKIARWKINTLAVQLEEKMYRTHRNINRNSDAREWYIYNPN